MSIIPAVEPEVEVVAPLDAVPIGSHEEDDHQCHREQGGTKTSSRAADGTPQKHDGRPSPEQVNSLDGDVLEALLFHLVCAQETEQKNSFAAGYVVC
jgi:hypothetical protein